MSDISDRRTDLPPRAIGVPDTGQGLFQKFEVRRTDGSSEPGGKHEGCEYFVLDTDHDTHAAAALRAYASACEGSHPLLARDLRRRHHLPAEAEMVSVPILCAFDERFPIGHLELRRDALPPTPDWCFSFGYRAMGLTGPQVSSYELEAVSITSDADYEQVIHREKGRRLVQPTVHIAKVLRERAIGIAREVAAGYEIKDGWQQGSAFADLAEHLLNEPELVKAIGAWCSAAENAVDAQDDRPGWTTSAPGNESEHARRLMAKHCSIELRCTLSAHQQEWWALNREREASEADILQVLAAGLQARRVESDRKPAAGMNLSHEKRRGTGLGPVVLMETARWAGGTHDEYGGWTFSPNAWEKFTTSLSADQPMEIMTSPGISAPESVVYDRCIERGCQEALPCPQGKCAMGPGEQA